MTDANYMLRNGDKLTLYLNKFKNIKSMGPQVIENDDPMVIKYPDQVEAITDSKPTHLFWHLGKNEMKLFMYIVIISSTSLRNIQVSQSAIIAFVKYGRRN
jgi:hypothetical protein